MGRLWRERTKEWTTYEDDFHKRRFVHQKLLVHLIRSGEGTLTFHGKTYPFKISGASFGATVALTVKDKR